MDHWIKSKAHLKIILSGVILVIFIAAIVIFLLKNDNKDVELADYVNITFAGLNEYGRVEFSVNTEKLYEALAGDEKNYIVLDQLSQVVQSVSPSASRSNLSNGDSVTIDIDYDHELADKMGCRFTETSFIVRVSGLRTGTVIDIFENVSVVVAGISPQAYANVVNQWEDGYLKGVSFSIKNPANVSKGDMLTVVCDTPNEEIMEQGYILKSFEKEFKVDTVNIYVSEVSEIDRNVLEEIRKEAVETIKKETESLMFRMFYKASLDSAYLFQFNNEWVNSTSLETAKLLIKKEQAQGLTQNYIYLIFKANISNGTTTQDIYFSFEYPESIITIDKKFFVTHDNPASRYVCAMDYESIYGRAIQSKEADYDIFEIENAD